jgi:hypothetical protein
MRIKLDQYMENKPEWDFGSADWISRYEIPGGTVVIVAKYPLKPIPDAPTTGPSFDWVTFQIADDRVVTFNSVQLNTQPPPVPAAEYPWPECEVIVHYMRIMTDDPNYQFEKWVSRTQPWGSDGSFLILAKCYSEVPDSQPDFFVGPFAVSLRTQRSVAAFQVNNGRVVKAY